MHEIRGAGRFPSEKQNVAVGEGEIRVGALRFRGKKDGAAPFLLAPGLEGLPGRTPGKRGDFDIVHARAPQRPVRHVEAGRLDDIHHKTETGGKPKDRAGIAGYVRLEKRDADSRRMLVHERSDLCVKAPRPMRTEKTGHDLWPET